MLKRLVKEATGGFSSGGERASTRKGETRPSSSKKKSRQRRSDDEEDEDEDNGRRPRRRAAGDADSEATATDDQAHSARKDRPAKNSQRGDEMSARQRNANRLRREPLIEQHVIEAVYSAMHGKKRKRARQELLGLFAKYDPEETGMVEDGDFKKCITKVGIKIDGDDDYEALARCFRPARSQGDDEDTSEEKTKRTKNKSTKKYIQYRLFIEFACNVRDSERLSALADKLRHVIDKYDDKHGRATTTPFNIFTDLKALDKSKREWIPSDIFVEFMEEHRRPTFQLSNSEILTLVERFEYDFGKDELGVDYKQFSEWLQPMLHLDKKALHRRVKALISIAQETRGWQLDDVFEAIDDDGDGHVTGDELKDALLELGLPLTDAQIMCLVDEYDTNDDGKIQYEEFVSNFSRKKDKTRHHRDEGTDDSTREARRRVKSGKRTVRNTFSWGIAKAFAKKHAQASTQGENPHSSKKKQPSKPASSSSSSSDTRASKRRSDAKAKSQRLQVSESEGVESEQQTKQRDRQKKKVRQRQETSSESDVDPMPPQSNHTSKRSKTKKAESESAETNTENQHTVSRRKIHKREKTERSRRRSIKKSPATDTASDAVAADKVPSSASARSPRKRQSRIRSSAPMRSPSRTRSQINNTSRRMSNNQTAKPKKSKLRRRRVARSLPGEDMNGTSTSTADSRHSGSESGLDAVAVRKMQNAGYTRRGNTAHRQHQTLNENNMSYDSNSSDTEHDKSKSDIEYERHLKRSLQRAFDFFDIDHSSTIDKKELGHVLRALGHEFTSRELDQEMDRADCDKNGKLDFHEFFSFVKQQLGQKAYLLSRQREMEIRQAFQSLDADKSGYLDEKEFEFLVYKVLQVELSVEEQDALLDFVDENGDGAINEDEFIAFMKTMEKFHQHGAISERKQREMLSDLDSLSRLACSAMKKLVRGAPMDLDKNLLMFFGIPSNFRPAITSSASCRSLYENSMEYMLAFPCPETVVGLAQCTVNTVGINKETSILGLSTKEDPSEEAALVRQAESWQAHAIVSIKRASGVPKPFDTREEDVIKRCVHVCLFQDQGYVQTKRRHKKKPSVRNEGDPSHSKEANAGIVVGNVHEIPVHWSPQEEDVWEFSKKTTKENKYKFLVRTNHVNDNLCLLVEFIVHLRIVGSDGSKKKTRASRSRSSHQRPTSSDTILHDDNGNTFREMVSCWCKIPLRTLLAKRSDVYRSQEKLWGGTAHAPVDIEHDEILRRRTGWRAITNAFRAPSSPTVGIKSVPVESLSEDLQSCVRKMPPVLIAPFLALPILSEFMQLMHNSLSTKLNAPTATVCDPVLKLLPKVVDDHEALSAFRRAFDAEMGSAKIVEDRQQRFRDLVLRMWPSFVEALDRIPMTVVQDAKGTASTTRRLSLLATTTPTTSQGTTTNQPPLEHQERVDVLQCTAQGKLRLRDMPVPIAPFHIREVAFERLL